MSCFALYACYFVVAGIRKNDIFIRLLFFFSCVEFSFLPVAEKLSNQFLHFADAHQHLTGFRWTRENNFHITLFYWWSRRENIPEISVRLKGCFQIKPFRSAFWSFWNQERKRITWNFLGSFSQTGWIFRSCTQSTGCSEGIHDNSYSTSGSNSAHHTCSCKSFFRHRTCSYKSSFARKHNELIMRNCGRQTQTNEGVRYDSLCRFDFITAWLFVQKCVGVYFGSAEKKDFL